jgi:outer membrane protein assembly factor BamB
MGLAKQKSMQWHALALCTLAVGLCVYEPAALARRRVLVSPAVVDVMAGDSEDATKTNGFSVKKEDQKVLEQFDDFERFRDKKAWDRAFKALDTISGTADSGAMSSTKDGFWIPTRQKFVRSLVSLPPEGREAYRLFNDAKARQNLDKALAHEAAGDADSIELLKKTVDQFLITSVGDKAADRLGDALFEAGDYAGAQRAWGQILSYYPETTLPTVRLQIKQATAMARSGRWEPFRVLAASLNEKHAGETIKIGGREMAISEYLALLARPTTTQPATTQVLAETSSDLSPLKLPKDDHPAWQMEFLDPALSEKMFAQINQNGWGMQAAPMLKVVPAAVTDGKRVYVNWYGIVWAIDGETGKLVWWSDHFKKLAEKFNELMQWQVDSSRFTVTLVGDALLTVSVNLDKVNNQEPFRLACLDAATGKRKWTTETGPLQGWAFVGSPLVVDSEIYITAHPKDTQEIHLLALSMDGKLRWESKLGQPQLGNNWRGQPVYALPLLKYVGGMLYICTNNGAVIAFDTASHAMQWAFSYDRGPVQDQNNGRFGWNGNQMEVSEPPASVWTHDGSLFFKDRGGRMMFEIDLAGPSMKWSRPIGEDTTVVGYDDSNFYLLSTGPDNTFLSTVDWDSGEMVRSSKLPDATDAVRALSAGGKYLLFLSRGIFEVDTTITDVTRDTRSFRGFDKDSQGGSLLRAGNKLISVSNLSVTAYPMGDEATAGR